LLSHPNYLLTQLLLERFSNFCSAFAQGTSLRGNNCTLLLKCQGMEDAGVSYKQLQQLRAVWPEGKTELDFKRQMKPNSKQTYQTKAKPVILNFPKKILLFLNHFFS